MSTHWTALILTRGPYWSSRDGSRSTGPGGRLLQGRPPTLSTLLSLLLTLGVLTSSGLLGPVRGDGHPVTHCGGYVNGSHGYIQTPGFPRRFPTPISCQWLIHAPPGKKIVLYFTQYYMRESFKLTEFDSYQDADNFRGKHDLGEISFEEEVTSYTVYKPYLMLKFQVQKIGNIHLRVFDFLLDVYGFNITYEIVDDQGPVRTDACSVFKCSFLGNCLAERNFETYKCHCFPGFFGDDCQYGPYCNPDKGINMCWNGGKCRYFFGSLVNTCECLPGYYGVLCEKKQEDFGKTECEKIGCNQKCMKEEETDTYRCLCAEGYRLMEDNKTCLEKGRMRYNVKTRCSLTSADSPVTAESLSTVCPDFKEQITDTITTRLAPKLKEFNNFSVVNISLADKGFFYIEVIFIGEKVDSKQARKGFYDIIHLGDVCGCHMDKDFIVFDSRPALHMLTLENYDDKPTLVGELLTLVCRAKGSSGLQFTWLKDGAPVYVHRTARNMWITTVPTSDGESRMSVLNIDHAHMLDEGEFTCRATDWNETKEKTVSVVVTPAPHLEVTPLITTVLQGETTRCKCLSSDDERGDFKYHWVKGDKELRPTTAAKAEGYEVVEDLFPIGSRLTVRAGPRTERYTCVVTAPSGQANGTCQVTVAKVSMETRSCRSEEYLDVSWQETAENQTDIKPCPRNTRVFATRKCTCTMETMCTWEDPNFSKCVSPELLRVEQELTKLQLGYMVTNVTTVLRLLQGFLSGQNATTPNPRPLTGDLQLAIQILAGCQDYLRRFPPGNLQGPGLPEIVGLASIILTRSKCASPEERKEMSMGQYILDLFSSIRRDPRILHPGSAVGEPITAPAIELQISRVSSSSRWDSAPLYSGPHAAVTLPLSLQANTLLPPAPPLVAPRRPRRQPRKDETFTMVTAVYENLQELISNDSLVLFEYVVNSQVVSVGPYVEWDDLDAAAENVSRIVDIRFEHSGLQPPHQSPNITACLHWRSPRDDEKTGYWSRGGCSVLQSQAYTTSCRCRTPGHFVVVMTSNTEKIISSMHDDLGVIPLIGCTLSLTGMVAALVVHLCFWSHMKDNLKEITLNFCVAVIVLDCVLMATFSRKQTQLLCRSQFLAVVICYMGALVFLTTELFHIRFSTFKVAVTLTPIKLSLAGWGAVFCVVIAIITCGQLIGYSAMDGRYCWLVRQTWEFYAFIAPATIVLAVYACLVVLLVRDVTCQNLPKKERRRYIFYACRSLVLQTYLIVSCVMSVALVNSAALVYQQVFAAAIAALGITFFAFHCVVMVKVRPDNLLSMKHLAERYGYVFDPCLNRVRSLLNKHKTEIPSIESTGSFKAFLKPTDGSKTTGSSAEAAVSFDDTAPSRQSYVRDKRSYAGERKEQLRSLLASSSESGGSSKESDPRELLGRDPPAPSPAPQGGNNGEDGVETLPSNYRTISEYIASLQQRAAAAANVDGKNDGSGSGQDSLTAPASSKPARGRSFILSDGDDPRRVGSQGGYAETAGSRSSVDSDRHSQKTAAIPNPFPDLKASGESLTASESSRTDLQVLEVGDMAGDDLRASDGRLSRQLEPVMCYVLTEPQGQSQENSRGKGTPTKQGSRKARSTKGRTKEI